MADKEIGTRLKQARESIKMTQKEVCNTLGIPKPQTLSAYERGENSPPIEAIKGLSKLYHVSIDWIILGEEFQEPKPKAKSDYIIDLFHAIDQLGLLFAEETDWNNNHTGSYIICVRNCKLRGFDDLISDLYSLEKARSVLDVEDYEMLFKKRIRKRAAESNDFEEIEEAPSQTLYSLQGQDDGQLPF